MVLLYQQCRSFPSLVQRRGQNLPSQLGDLNEWEQVIARAWGRGERLRISMAVDWGTRRPSKDRGTASESSSVGSQSRVAMAAQAWKHLEEA